MALSDDTRATQAGLAGMEVLIDLPPSNGLDSDEIDFLRRVGVAILDAYAESRGTLGANAIPGSQPDNQQEPQEEQS